MNYKIIGKYIKDLRFRIPNPKTFFLLSKNISNYKINVDIKSEQIKENIIEVLTAINLTPTINYNDQIETKIVYSAIIELNDKIEKQQLEKIVLIEVQTEIYSELIRVFFSLFENSGFKNIKINEKVDFKQLYDSRNIQ
ncbi:MAG: protein-export chaperone SecB [Pseudomonadota bacterium]|nr:protein-export chaperone SecB [Pseudomonadota bacterium]